MTYKLTRTAVTIADPNNPVGTMDTGVELLAQLVRDGVLAPDFKLTGHRDWSSTECPGAYYGWLPSIRQRVDDALATTTTQED